MISNGSVRLNPFCALIIFPVALKSEKTELTPAFESLLFAPR